MFEVEKKPKAMWVGYIKDGHIIKGQFLLFIEKHATTNFTNAPITLHTPHILLTYIHNTHQTPPPHALNMVTILSGLAPSNLTNNALF